MTLSSVAPLSLICTKDGYLDKVQVKPKRNRRGTDCIGPCSISLSFILISIIFLLLFLPWANAAESDVDNGNIRVTWSGMRNMQFGNRSTIRFNTEYNGFPLIQHCLIHAEHTECGRSLFPVYQQLPELPHTGCAYATPGCQCVQWIPFSIESDLFEASDTAVGVDANCMLIRNIKQPSMDWIEQNAVHPCWTDELTVRWALQPIGMMPSSEALSMAMSGMNATPSDERHLLNACTAAAQKEREQAFAANRLRGVKTQSNLKPYGCQVTLQHTVDLCFYP